MVLELGAFTFILVVLFGVMVAEKVALIMGKRKLAKCIKFVNDFFSPGFIIVCVLVFTAIGVHTVATM